MYPPQSGEGGGGGGGVRRAYATRDVARAGSEVLPLRG
jgi:hypothetical protein